MAKNHLKRLAAPRTWPLPRKVDIFITKPNPGAHKMLFGMPLATVMTGLIKCANTKKEVKNIIRNKNVLVDGKRRNDEKFIVGLMDTISLKEIDEYYRIVLCSRGKITAVKIDERESLIKPARIINKKALKKGIIQLNTDDGRNMLVKKDDYKAGDTVVISLPGQNITEHLKLETGMTAYMTGGKYMGDIGVIEAIDGQKIKIKSGKGVYETARKYAFVVGKDRPVIKLVQ